MFKGGKPSQRYVPGGGVPGAPAKDANGVDDKDKKKRVRSKRPLKEQVEEVVEGVKDVVVSAAEAVGVVAATSGEGDDATAKKLRNLNKKVGSGISIMAGEGNANGRDS
jgi:translation initiation factor 2A